MYGGAFGENRTPLRWIYRAFYILIMVNMADYFFYVGNFLAIRLLDPVEDRYGNNFNFWAFWVTIFNGVPWFFTIMLMFHNKSKTMYKIQAFVSGFTGAGMALFIVKLTCIDWPNCQNVSYCQNVKPNKTDADYSFVIAFITGSVLLIFDVVYLIFGIHLRNRIAFRALGDFYSNPYRLQDGNAMEVPGISQKIGKRIGAFIKQGTSPREAVDRDQSRLKELLFMVGSENKWRREDIEKKFEMLRIIYDSDGEFISADQVDQFGSLLEIMQEARERRRTEYYKTLGVSNKEKGWSYGFADRAMKAGGGIVNILNKRRFAMKKTYVLGH